MFAKAAHAWIVWLLLVSSAVMLMVVAGGSTAAGSSTRAQSRKAGARGSLVQVSADPYRNATAEHATEVEADTVAAANRVVSVYQVGRYDSGCADDIGWSTTTNGGRSYGHGYLPGLTSSSRPKGPWDRASDPSVAHDARYGIWLASSLPCSGKSASVRALITSPAVAVNRSADGIHWSNWIEVAHVAKGQVFDKPWITCDNSASSPFFGNCYEEWDVENQRELVLMSTSTNGGLTWSAPTTTVGRLHGVGGEPVVQPNGTVVVPILDSKGLVAFRSTNGGRSWGRATPVAKRFYHPSVAMRAPRDPSVATDASGRIYVTWADCRFRARCASNDMVMTTSANGRTWSPVVRIPIDPVTTTVDHVGGGLGVNPSTAGTTARLGLFYYFYPHTACTVRTCLLEVGYLSSDDGGATWSKPLLIAGPMHLRQIASASGRFVGDYLGAAVLPHRGAFSALAVGRTPSGHQRYNEAMYSPHGGFAVRGGSTSSVAVGNRSSARRADHRTPGLRSGRAPAAR